MTLNVSDALSFIIAHWWPEIMTGQILTIEQQEDRRMGKTSSEKIEKERKRPKRGNKRWFKDNKG